MARGGVTVDTVLAGRLDEPEGAAPVVGVISTEDQGVTRGDVAIRLAEQLGLALMATRRRACLIDAGGRSSSMTRSLGTYRPQISDLADAGDIACLARGMVHRPTINTSILLGVGRNTGTVDAALTVCRSHSGGVVVDCELGGTDSATAARWMDGIILGVCDGTRQSAGDLADRLDALGASGVRDEQVMVLVCRKSHWRNRVKPLDRWHTTGVTMPTSMRWLAQDGEARETDGGLQPRQLTRRLRQVAHHLAGKPPARLEPGWWPCPQVLVDTLSRRLVDWRCWDEHDTNCLGRWLAGQFDDADAGGQVLACLVEDRGSVTFTELVELADLTRLIVNR
jgi:hypothetical protein